MQITPFVPKMAWNIREYVNHSFKKGSSDLHKQVRRFWVKPSLGYPTRGFCFGNPSFGLWKADWMSSFRAPWKLCFSNEINFGTKHRRQGSGRQSRYQLDTSMTYQGKTKNLSFFLKKSPGTGLERGNNGAVKKRGNSKGNQVMMFGVGCLTWPKWGSG